MNPALQSAIATGIVGIILLVLNQRANRRSEAATNALAARKVDNDGKAVDLSILTESIDELKEGRKDDRARMTALEDLLEAEREARVQAERRAAAAEQSAVKAGDRAERLERRVSLLEDTLRANKITVPAH